MEVTMEAIARLLESLATMEDNGTENEVEDTNHREWYMNAATLVRSKA